MDFALLVFLWLISHKDEKANINSQNTADNKINKKYNQENFRVIFYSVYEPSEANEELSLWMNSLIITFFLIFTFYIAWLKIITKLQNDYFQESIIKLAIVTCKISAKLSSEIKF